MKVVLINHSDTRGGASVVTLRLTEALRDIGVDATMLVGRKESTSACVVEGSAWRRQLSFAAEHLDIVAHNRLSRKNLFKISTGRYGMGLDRHPLVREADIVVVAWVNQGTMSLAEIERIARQKPVVWIMHDRWCQTGVCHHVPDGCERLECGCGMCPLLQTRSSRDLSSATYRDKQLMYGALPYPRLSFVAVSSWLAHASGIIPPGRMTVIPNAFPVEDYPCQPQKSRAEAGLPEGPLIAMGAARLDDPVKDLPLAIEALNRVSVRATAVFFGNVRDAHAFDRLEMPYVHLGPLDSRRVAEVLAHSTVVLSSSRFETLPTTLIEGMAAGCTPVTTGRGGQSDIIDNGRDGYIATVDMLPLSRIGIDTPSAADPAALGVFISRAILAPFDRRAQHEACARRFAARTVAARYREYFGRLLEKS